MSNPANTSVIIQTITIVPGPPDVNLTYSKGDGNVTETTAQGPATKAYTVAPALFAAGWSIVGAVVMPPLPVDISWSLKANGSGNALVIADAATVSDDLDFRIQLSLGGVIYTSPDPVVMNQPPV
ncbi:MAG: hypothetical protein ACK5VV_05755 [Lysobacteraceae bacterium]